MSNPGKLMRFLASSAVAAALVLVSMNSALAKDPQLPPQRLSSIGGSITLGGNAEQLGQNINASWVNGYHGFWQWVRGLGEVNSHNERITGIWGGAGRTNYVNAVAGASMADFRAQADKAVQQKATYVTVFLGHNDLCRRYAWQIPTDSIFETSFRVGLDRLKGGLPAGATIYVISLIDLERLYDVAQDQTGMGNTDCKVIWGHDRFPCKTALDPRNTEADRAYVRSRTVAFNAILERVTAEYREKDPRHYYYFTDAPFRYSFTEEDVSDIDCFHPSAIGQRALSEITWNEGPFGGYR